MDKIEVYADQRSETQSYIALKKKVLQNLPDLKTMARNFMQEHIKKTTGQDIDPDQVRLYLFKAAQPLNISYTGWAYWDPINSITLTELAFKNFSAPDQDRLPDTLNADYAVYQEGTPQEIPHSIPDRLVFILGEKYFGEKKSSQSLGI